MGVINFNLKKSMAHRHQSWRQVNEWGEEESPSEDYICNNDNCYLSPNYNEKRAEEARKKAKLAAVAPAKAKADFARLDAIMAANAKADAAAIDASKHTHWIGGQV